MRKFDFTEIRFCRDSFTKIGFTEIRSCSQVAENHEYRDTYKFSSMWATCPFFQILSVTCGHDQ